MLSLDRAFPGFDYWQSVSNFNSAVVPEFHANVIGEWLRTGFMVLQPGIALRIAASATWDNS
jgi:hypothetical protein